MSNNISPEWKFSLPSNSFYGNNSVKPASIATFNSFTIPTSSTKEWKTSRSSRTVFTQNSSRKIAEEIFLKEFGPLSRKRRNSTDSKRSSLSLPLNTKNMEISRNRSNRSTSPDWATSRFSLPAVKTKEEHKHMKRNRRSISKENKEEPKKENRHRSVSPDWNTSRFSLPPPTPRSTSSSPKTKKTSPLVNGNSASRNGRSSSRSASPDWNTSRFSLPKTPVDSLKSTHNTTAVVSPRIKANRLETKTKKNSMYTISQKTLDRLLPKPEILLFDVVKYGPKLQHKDDFLFGLNLMRSEVLKKINLLHYKKKLRNTGMNFIRTFQQPKKSDQDNLNNSKKVKKQIEIPDKPHEIVFADVETVDVTAQEANATDEIHKPEEIIQIDDDDDKEVDIESEKLLVEAIQDFADKFGGEVVEEITEKSNVIASNIDHSILNNNKNGNENNSVKETIKISETNTFYHSVTKKHTRNSLDSKTNSKTLNYTHKRNSLRNSKNIKKNGIPKKKPSPNKKKNIIKVKWPIARKSLLDLRNDN